MAKCGVTCCVLVPTPKSANKKGMKSYRAFIWTMFSLMLIVYLICIPMTFAFTIGGIIVPVGVLSFLFSAMFTPGCKTTKQLRKHHPEYALKLSNYITISWALGLTTFITSICAASMFYNYYIYNTYDFYKSCIYGPGYSMSTDYYSDAYRLYWDYDYDCPVVMGGFIFAIITSVLAAIQIIFVPYCLRLQYYASDGAKGILSNSDNIHRNGMDVEGYGMGSQIIKSDSDSWNKGKKDRKNKKNKKNNKIMMNEMRANDPRVEQLMFAIQGMAGQIKNLQGNAQIGSQQHQQFQPPQLQPQVSQPLIFPQLNVVQ